MSKPSNIRVAMARAVAARWVLANSKCEYRFSAFSPNYAEVKKTAFHLRFWRDGKTKIGSLGAPSKVSSSMGIREIGAGDAFEVWSSDPDLMKRVAKWLEGRGFQTTWVF
jgi:hypothetical protein